MFKRRSLLPLLMAVPLVAGVAARSGQQADQAAQRQAPAMPEPTAAAVWKHLEAANYGSWSMWPGTKAFYPGNESHGNLLTTFVNEPAMRALRMRQDVMPNGAIIVTQNYNPERHFMSMTVMYKAPAGYDPEHNDWFWMKRMPDGEIAAEGKVEACITCHAAGTDYTLTARRGVPASPIAVEGTR